MLVRIITNRLNKFKYGDILEEDSPRVRCLLENGEAESLEEPQGVPDPVLANPETEEVKEIIEAPVKKKAGRPKKVK
jgi:hypothetical protein